MINNKLFRSAERLIIIILAHYAFSFAKISANTACHMPYYEPTQPKEIKKLKKR